MNVNIMDKSQADTIRETVREHYKESALRASTGGCCSDPISSDLYSPEDAKDVPAEALVASLGCGNPIALAKLNPGDVVLDLGSGGGIDVLLSAKRVGPTGFAYGLDMTDEMLALAEENRKKSGLENVRFLKGYIEEIPLPDSTVDAVISNCVINLSADKRAVLREAFRVLKPGGQFAVSDVITLGDPPEGLMQSLEAWAGCVAGALPDHVFRSILAEVGFEDISIEVTRKYTEQDVTTESSCCSSTEASAGGCCSPVATTWKPEEVNNLFASAFIRARKPVAQK